MGNLPGEKGNQSRPITGIRRLDRGETWVSPEGKNHWEDYRRRNCEEKGGGSLRGIYHGSATSKKIHGTGGSLAWSGNSRKERVKKDRMWTNVGGRGSRYSGKTEKKSKRKKLKKLRGKTSEAGPTRPEGKLGEGFRGKGQQCVVSGNMGKAKGDAERTDKGNRKSRELKSVGKN